MKTEIIKVENENDHRLSDAASIIRDGGLVVFPTETVYGLGADALNSEASSKIYSAKGRPSDNPLIVHISDPADAEKYAICDEMYKRIAAHFMPGPITVIMKKRAVVPDSVTGGLDSVAIRCPENRIARILIELSNRPIAAPSANISGKPSPTRAEHVIEDMDGKVDMIIDGGACSVGVESTIVSVLGGRVRLLRPGKITLEELRELVGEVEVDSAVTRKMAEGEKPLAPGMKYRHYAPKAPVWAVLGSDDKVRRFFLDRIGEKKGVLCYTEDALLLPEYENLLTFGSQSDRGEEARLLFDALRHFDKLAVNEIYCRLPDSGGLGLAVRNRLIKACGFNEINLDKSPVVGVCGSMGSGKSTLGQALEAQGAYRIDCDRVYAKMTDKPSECLSELALTFGNEIITGSGSLNRRALSKIVFGNDEKLSLLNSLTHKYISAEVDRLILEHRKSGEGLIIIEAPLLFESGFNKKCDKTVAVVAAKDIKIKRVIVRDGISENEAVMRLAHQISDDEISSRCDFVFENSFENGIPQELSQALFKELTE